MGLFDFLKAKKEHVDYSNKGKSKKFDYLQNPSNFFSHLGPTLNILWQNIVKGENQAVNIFYNYKQFSNALKIQYSDCDFNRIATNINTEESGINITSGELMYLYLLDLDKDIYLSKSCDLSDVFLLNHQELQTSLSKLNDRELSYITQLKKYIQTNITKLCSEVSIMRYSVNIIETDLPVNTLDCVKYHQFLMDAEVNRTYCHGEKWFYYRWRKNRFNKIKNRVDRVYRRRQSRCARGHVYDRYL